MAPEPEPMVLREALGGDRDAFGRIVLLYQDWVFRLAYRMVWDAHEAKDLSQEIFLRLYRCMDKYEPSRPFGPWFLRLATNVCLNGLKRRKGASRVQSLDAAGEVAEPEGKEPGGLEAAGTADRAARLREAVSELPPDYRAVISMRYLEGASYEDIAEALDLPVGTVKNRLFRARERLKQAMEMEEAERR
jgi:RNA polymerase sigma-70 factor (ECF subfamily)